MAKGKVAEAPRQMGMAPVAPQLEGTVAREGFGSREVATSREHGTAGAMSKAQEEVRAAYVMALQRPRDMGKVHDRIIEACKRPAFAAKARYKLPRGNCKECKGSGKQYGSPCKDCDGKGKNIVEGFTVRFAETCFASLGNVRQQNVIISDDGARRVRRHVLIDLESNSIYETDVAVDKTVERRELKQGQNSLGTRLNSWGDRVHLLPATEDDLRQKENNYLARARRENILQAIPADIREEALDVVLETIRSAIDPKEEAKQALTAFGSLKPPVGQAELEKHLGKALAAATVDEWLDLRQLYAALESGETTWAEVTGANEPATATPAPDTPRSETLNEKLRQQAAKPPAAPASAPAPEPASAPAAARDTEASQATLGRLRGILLASGEKTVDAHVKAVAALGLQLRALEDLTEKEALFAIGELDPSKGAPPK